MASKKGAKTRTGKTIKDQPDWVSNKDQKLWIGEVHRCDGQTNLCDIDTQHPAKHGPHCYRNMRIGVDPSMRWRHHTCTSTKAERELEYWGPARADERVIIGQYDGGDLEIEGRTRRAPYKRGYWC